MKRALCPTRFTACGAQIEARQNYSFRVGYAWSRGNCTDEPDGYLFGSAPLSEAAFHLREVERAFPHLEDVGSDGETDADADDSDGLAQHFVVTAKLSNHLGKFGLSDVADICIEGAEGGTSHSSWLPHTSKFVST